MESSYGDIACSSQDFPLIHGRLGNSLLLHVGIDNCFSRSLASLSLPQDLFVRRNHLHVFVWEMSVLFDHVHCLLFSLSLPHADHLSLGCVWSNQGKGTLAHKRTEHFV